MARIRSIKIDLFVDDALADVSLAAHFLLAGLPVIADSAGRLEDRPRRIHAQIFPYRPEVDTDGCLSELARAGAVTRYVVDGVRYLEVAGWAKDQRPHVKEAASVIPPPLDSTEPRLDRELAGNSPGTRPDKSAGIRDSGLGVLDSGVSASQEPAVPPREELRLAPVKTPRQKRTPADRAPADPRHAPLSLALVAAGWPHHGGRTAKALALLLSHADREPGVTDAQAEILRRAGIARAWVGFPQAREIHELEASWGHFSQPQAARGAGPPDVRRGSVRAELIDHTKPEEPF